ncbi:hypothetical protein D3C75_864570 [compost metagenome]
MFVHRNSVCAHRYTASSGSYRIEVRSDQIGSSPYSICPRALFLIQNLLLFRLHPKFVGKGVLKLAVFLEFDPAVSVKVQRLVIGHMNSLLCFPIHKSPYDTPINNHPSFWTGRIVLRHTSATLRENTGLYSQEASAPFRRARRTSFRENAPIFREQPPSPEQEPMCRRPWLQLRQARKAPPTV